MNTDAVPQTLGALVASTLWLCSQAQDAQDPGSRIAQMVCSACHLVANGQPPPILNPPAPSFCEISNRASASAGSMKRFVMHPHGTGAENTKMPDPMLMNDQAVEVTRYVLGLKGHCHF